MRSRLLLRSEPDEITAVEANKVKVVKSAGVTITVTIYSRSQDIFITVAYRACNQIGSFFMVILVLKVTCPERIFEVEDEK